jgi:BirA family biotin operon repressor/biotin-[acetyl-CoA-carboxylase] ligase
VPQLGPCSDVQLPPEVEAAGYRLASVDRTGSTNDDAAAAARGGDPGRLWVVAGEQQAGWGRHGRNWSSPPGNLYASLLLIDPCEPALAPQLGFLAGLALHDAIAEAASLAAPRLALKWPNDLLLDGAKVSGLLLEGHRTAFGRLAIVIGFGVNLAHAPAGTPYPARPLQNVQPGLTRDVLFGLLARSFARCHAAWAKARHLTASDPFASVRRQWLERSVGLGQSVTVRLPSGERSGTFEGLDRCGRLQLRTPGGLELIDAGDLYFPNLNRTPAAPAADGSRS